MAARATTGAIYDYEAGELDELTSMGGPLRPRIPIWVVGVWARPKSMNRELRCDGIVPQYQGLGDARPEDARAVREWLDERNGSEIELVSQGETPAGDPKAARAQVASWAKAGLDLVARDKVGDASWRRRTYATGQAETQGRAPASG